MKRCCAERKTILDAAIETAKMYDKSMSSDLSEKELKFLNLYVSIGLGSWVDDTYIFTH
mgnify:FL=1|jgi:hypothetical protein